MKILKYSLFIVATFLLMNASAQDENQKLSSKLLPQKGDFGTSVVVNGLLDDINLGAITNEYGQNILFAKYYLEDDLVVRAGFGLNVINSKREKADSVGLFLVENDSVSRSFTLNISGGIEKHLAPSRRLDPFLFAQVDLSFIGKTKTESDIRNISSAGTSSLQTETKRDGGLAVGFQIGSGFNYFLAPKFSIGAELALRLQYVKVGGTVSENTSARAANGSTVSSFDSREDLSKETDVNIEPNALINFSYFF